MSPTLRTLTLPLIACSLVLGFSIFAWKQQHNLSEQKQLAHFNALAAETAASLQQRLDTSEQLLLSVGALYASSNTVTRDELTRFLSAQKGALRASGMRTVSIAQLVLPEQRQDFIEAQRQNGLPDFAIRPSGERGLYAPIIQISPTITAAPNEIGRDLFAFPDQQRILTQARDTGLTQLSGKLMLSSEAGNTIPSFILAVPLFAKNTATNSIDERRSHIQGWAVASISANDLIQSSFGEKGPDLDLSLLTSNADDPDALLFQSDALSGRSTVAKPQFSARLPLSLGEQSWTLQLSSPAKFSDESGVRPTLLTALLGGALAVALFFLYQYLSTSQALASAAAEKAADALNDAEERWRFALEGSGDGVWDWDVQSSSIHFSPRCDVILGVPTNGARSALIHPEDEGPEKAAMLACLEGRSSQYASEHRMQGEDGQWRWIAARGMVLARTATGAAARMIGTVTDITERKTAADRLNNMAQHDAITGLPNRTLFFDRLQQALHLAKRHKETLGLMYVDLDNFRGINDQFGRSVGEKLLREVSETLSGTVRDSDTVAHFGEDDFVILLPTLANEADAGPVAEKIRAALDRDFVINGRHIRVTASIGVALFPQHARSAETLLNGAARALQQARKSGRNTVCFSLSTSRG